MQLSSVFYTCWTTTNDDHVHEPVDFLFRLVLESGSFHT